MMKYFLLLLLATNLYAQEKTEHFLFKGRSNYNTLTCDFKDKDSDLQFKIKLEGRKFPIIDTFEFREGGDGQSDDNFFSLLKTGVAKLEKGEISLLNKVSDENGEKLASVKEGLLSKEGQKTIVQVDSEGAEYVFKRFYEMTALIDNEDGVISVVDGYVAKLYIDEDGEEAGIDNLKFGLDFFFWYNPKTEKGSLKHREGLGSKTYQVRSCELSLELE